MTFLPSPLYLRGQLQFRCLDLSRLLLDGQDGPGLLADIVYLCSVVEVPTA